MNTDNLILAAMSFLVSGMNIQRFYEKKRVNSLIFGLIYAVMGVAYGLLAVQKKEKRSNHE